MLRPLDDAVREAEWTATGTYQALSSHLRETLVRLREVERLVAESERERNPETADAALLQALGMVDDDLRDLVGAHRTWDYLRLQVDERGQRLSRVYLDPAGETHLRKIAQTMEAAGWPSGTALPELQAIFAGLNGTIEGESSAEDISVRRLRPRVAAASATLTGVYEGFRSRVEARTTGDLVRAAVRGYVHRGKAVLSATVVLVALGPSTHAFDGVRQAYEDIRRGTRWLGRPDPRGCANSPRRLASSRAEQSRR